MSFEAEVLERSREIPVIVDFWAEWCGPCRVLGPVLERLAREYSGRLVVAKLDVDRAQGLAAAFQIRSIPAVLGFRDGKAVEEFVGVLPEAEIREFIGRLLPTGADLHVREALGLRETDPRRAEDLLRSVLASDSRHDAARLGLAALLVQRGANSDAEELLEGRLFVGEQEEEAGRLRAILRLRRAAAELGDEPSCRARLEAEPRSAERLYELGCVLAAAGKYREGLEHLLRAAEEDKALGREKVREIMVGVFQIAGTRSDLANEYRDRLASVLY
jgi:putative thioredoxin